MRTAKSEPTKGALKRGAFSFTGEPFWILVSPREVWEEGVARCLWLRSMGRALGWSLLRSDPSEVIRTHEGRLVRLASFASVCERLLGYVSHRMRDKRIREQQYVDKHSAGQRFGRSSFLLPLHIENRNLLKKGTLVASFRNLGQSRSALAVRRRGRGRDDHR